MGLGLAAALTPRRSHGTPAVPADGTDEAVGVAPREEGVAQQALRGEKELFDNTWRT